MDRPLTSEQLCLRPWLQAKAGKRLERRKATTPEPRWPAELHSWNTKANVWCPNLLVQQLLKLQFVTAWWGTSAWHKHGTAQVHMQIRQKTNIVMDSCWSLESIETGPCPICYPHSNKRNVAEGNTFVTETWGTQVVCLTPSWRYTLWICPS